MQQSKKNETRSECGNMNFLLVHVTWKKITNEVKIILLQSSDDLATFADMLPIQKFYSKMLLNTLNTECTQNLVQMNSQCR